ncbi:bifunctional peptidase and arginyl-hydroxylase JMJD5-like [Ylistrum balloti]|uniref:bifunctional peptidase and arginyl-hydroxylase JMJD5-like n=1 Tax=Ylistrum balloti TaxID=509963 RepID=UPI002905E4B3|nr:bifunctional peptidase and arginyl-hydroxylase JMJD5-like [Ylistrum balloti]
MATELVQKLLADVPESRSTLVDCVTTPNEMTSPVFSLLNRLIETFLGKDYDLCIKLCEPLLDITWEKLNTGHWKDVHVCWRHLYSLVSLLKGVSQVVITTSCVTDTGSGALKDDLTNSIKTFDMGLLMGAPIFGNVLSKMSVYVHNYLDTYLNLQLSSAESFPLNQKEHTSESDSKIKPPYDSVNHGFVIDKSDDLENPENPPKRQKTGTSDIEINMENEIQRISCPSMEYFRKEFLLTKQPVIITNAMDHWPAMDKRRWSLNYLQKRAGYRTVPIEIGSKYTDDKWTQKLMTIGEFIDQFITTEMKSSTDDISLRSKHVNPVGYLAQHQLFNQIPELLDDILIPDYCLLGGTGSENPDTSDACRQEDTEDVDINAWFGPKGTVSPLHHDPKENFLAQVVGRKYVRLYSEAMTPYLYPYDGFMDNTSRVDIEHPNFSMFPRFKNATYRECVLDEGEMLFIPRKCWHFVKSLSISFSVSFWWK